MGEVGSNSENPSYGAGSFRQCACEMKPTPPPKPRSEPGYSVETVQVTKVYRVGHIDYPALRGVSLKIERGELTSIIGASGSGKSTLLNIMGALDPPTSGRVIVDGIDLKKLDEDRVALLRNLRIGFIYQSFNLVTRLTSVENVEMPLIARGISEQARKRRSLEMLSAVGLAQKVNKRPAELSGGEQQRVAIARALVTKPALVLGDEPTGNVDSKTTREIIDYIIQVNKTLGTTFVLVTHNPEVANMSHRVITVKDGLIEKDQHLPRMDSYAGL
jgi:putative ABC transport system ATP-binding protein